MQNVVVVEPALEYLRKSSAGSRPPRRGSEQGRSFQSQSHSTATADSSHTTSCSSHKTPQSSSALSWDTKDLLSTPSSSLMYPGSVVSHQLESSSSSSSSSNYNNDNNISNNSSSAASSNNEQQRHKRDDPKGWQNTRHPPSRRKSVDEQSITTSNTGETQSTKKYSNTKLDTMNKYKTLYEEMLKEAQKDGGNTLNNDTCGGGTSVKKMDHNNSSFCSNSFSYAGIANKSAFHNSGSTGKGGGEGGADRDMNRGHGSSLVASNKQSGIQLSSEYDTPPQKKQLVPHQTNNVNVDSCSTVEMPSAPIELELRNARKLIQPPPRRTVTSATTASCAKKPSHNQAGSKSSGSEKGELQQISSTKTSSRRPSTDKPRRRKTVDGKKDQDSLSSSKVRRMDAVRRRKSSIDDTHDTDEIASVTSGRSTRSERSLRSNRSSKSNHSTRSNHSCRSQSSHRSGGSQRSRGSSRSQSSRSRPIINMIETENQLRKEKQKSLFSFGKIKLFATKLKDIIHPTIHKYKISERARYKVMKVPKKCKKMFDEDTGTVEVEIMAVHVDAVMEHPYYTIKLPDGQFKQTNWDNLMPLKDYIKMKENVNGNANQRGRSMSMIRPFSRSLSRSRAHVEDEKKDRPISKNHRSRSTSRPRSSSRGPPGSKFNRSNSTNGDTLSSPRSRSNRQQQRHGRPKRRVTTGDDASIGAKTQLSTTTRKQNNLSSSINQGVKG